MSGGRKTTSYKWAQLGSNQRPIPYEGTALTTELWALAECIVSYLLPVGKRVISDFTTVFSGLYPWQVVAIKLSYVFISYEFPLN
jgi:hypothetical protein